MWIQQGYTWHLGKIKVSVDLEMSGKNTLKYSLQVSSQSISIFMKVIRHWKQLKNKINSNTKQHQVQVQGYFIQHLLQKDQNADSNLLYSQEKNLWPNVYG